MSANTLNKAYICAIDCSMPSMARLASRYSSNIRKLPLGAARSSAEFRDILCPISLYYDIFVTLGGATPPVFAEPAKPHTVHCIAWRSLVKLY